MYSFAPILLFLPLTLGLYKKSTNVVQLNESNFHEETNNGDAIWLVQFYAPWCVKSQEFVAEYEKAAETLSSILKIGAFDCNESKDFCRQFEVSKYPQVILFNKNKNKQTNYTGEKTAEGISEFVLDMVKGKAEKKKDTAEVVVELTDDNFDDLVLKSNDHWMVKFYAPWCGHCKKLKPEWFKAAKKLKDQVKFGAVDATVHKIIGEKYLNEGYPTIRYFGQHFNPLGDLYNDGREASIIVDWINNKISHSLAPPKVAQILNEANVRDTCEDSMLCIIAMLPKIFDCGVDCRNSYIEMLSKLALKFKSQNWGWLWSEGEAQPELEKVLGVGGYGYPALVAANWRKQRYAVFRGSFSKDNLAAFLNDISKGKGQTSVIRAKMLPIIFDTYPWSPTDYDEGSRDEL